LKIENEERKVSSKTCFFCENPKIYICCHRCIAFPLFTYSRHYKTHKIRIGSLDINILCLLQKLPLTEKHLLLAPLGNSFEVPKC